MIHVVISKKDSIGPAGKMRVIGLEKSDLEVLAKDGIIQFDLVSSKFAIMFVKTSREEFISELNKLKTDDVAEPAIEDISGQPSDN